MGYADIRAMSEAELAEAHDKLTKRMRKSYSFYTEEIPRRKMEDHSKTVRNLTWTIMALIAVVTAATVVNVGLNASWW